MAHAIEASTNRVVEIVADTVLSQPPSPLAFVPSSSQDAGNHSGNATSRKGKEIQSVPPSHQDAGSHSENEAARKRNESFYGRTTRISLVAQLHRG
ncbi:hypothetical protein SLEP1_g30174 [Rubroshorea leprosula]|uniref:Uncharacterized protein n=1 Tax=Rubroshorea leprosula TaxID=152421 RepID=A0AAV5JZ94_9ROSI|nr:hypothetical protein SLEP1_g30174 [Rubroshorea leprosula]